MHKALGAAALILALTLSQLVAQGASEAAVLSAVRLQGGPQATEVTLAVDGLEAYSVARDGAGGLEVRLPGVKAAAGLSTTGLTDRRVKAVSVEASSEGLLVRIRSKLPRLGYVHQQSETGVSLCLFADAPGEQPQPAAKASAKAQASPAGAKAKKPKTEAKKPSAPAPEEAQAEQKAPAAPQLPEEKTAAPLPAPGSAVTADSTPAPLLATDEPRAELKVLAALPGSGPELDALLPGAEAPQQDKFLLRLRRTRESETAYRDAVLKLKAKAWSGARDAFAAIQAEYSGTVAAARAAFRAADCLFMQAQSKGTREKAMQAYLEAVSKSPLGDEVGRAYLQIGRLYQQSGYDYEALGAYGMTLKKGSDSPYALYAYLHRGDIYFKMGRLKEAEAEYQEVGRHFPNSAKVREANFRLVRALFAQKDFAGVERAYAEMRQRWPETFATDPDLLRYIGETYFQEGDYYRCRQFLFYVLNIYPDAAANHLILCRIADAFLAQGDHEDAEKLYRLLVTNFSKTEGAALARMRLAENGLGEGQALVDGLATGQRKLGDLELYKQIAAGSGDIAMRAKVRIGLWYYWQHDYTKAAEYLRDLLGREKGFSKVLEAEARYAIAEALYRQIKTCFDRGSYAELLKLAASWKDWLGGERAETYYYLGEAARRSHLAEDAVGYFVKAQDLPWREDKRRETLLGLGLARLDTGEYAQAAGGLGELVRTYGEFPSRAEALRALGRAEYLTGKYEAATLALEQALRLTKEPTKRAEDSYRMGLALIALQDYDRAVAAFQEALTSCATAGCDKPLEADASLELGNALYRLEHWGDAARAYGRAAKLAPRGAVAQQALYKAGKCYLALGRRREAAAAFGEGAQGEKGVWKKASAQMLDGLNMGELVP